MNSLRYVVGLATALFAIAYSGNLFADPVPGSACTVANSHMRSGGPENSGIVYEMTCQSSVWVITMTYAANSNVGIGTTNPQSKLHVAAAGANKAAIQIDSSSGGSQIYSATEGGWNQMMMMYWGAGWTSASNGNTLGTLEFHGADATGTPVDRPSSVITGAVDAAPTAGSVAGRLVFSTAASGSGTATERMRINSSGKVGIGTTSPSATLDVATTSTSWPRGVRSMQFSSSGNSAVFSAVKARGTVGSPTTVVNGDWLGSFNVEAYDGSAYLNPGWMMFISNGTVATGSIPTDFVLYTGSNNNPSERLRVTSAGNVGIGTTNPTSKLQVIGRIVSSAVANSDALTTITADFSSANTLRSTGASAACGTLNFTNTVSGGSFTITILNTTALCTTVQWNGVTTDVILPSSYIGGTAVTGAVYTAVDDGAKLWVSYVPF